MNETVAPPVLMAHCYYRQRGGEDLSFEAESRLLSGRGQPVSLYVRRNSEIDSYGPARRARLAWRTIWAGDSRRDLDAIIARNRPFIAHFQNTFPLISPSAYAACRSGGLPVVQSLRNYRLLCPKSTFLRDGRICEECLGQAVAWPGVAYGCYRDSRAQTAVVAAMLSFHRMIGTWERQVDLFVVPSRFARDKFIAGGLSPQHIIVKPNFTEDPGPPSPLPEAGTILFVGRLSEEKGVEDLIRAAALIKRSERLRIVGDGPLRRTCESMLAEQGLPRTILQGTLGEDRVREEIRRSAVVVVPSRCYETFGRVVVEAYAGARPVITSRLGALQELVLDRETGLLFEPGDVPSLASALDRLLSNSAELRRMGRRARAEYEARYTPEENFRLLMGVYRRACEHRGSRIPETLTPFASATEEGPSTARVG